MTSLKIFLCLLVSELVVSTGNELFPLTIIHLNDMHARYEEINTNSHACKPGDKCIGGYARVVSKVKELKANSPNPIYMNAADNFVGTYWYNYFRWNVTQYFLDLEPADVMTIGNHEFDHGVKGLIPFLERINSPVISCNINATLEPEFKKLFNNSIIIEKEGRQIGIVGVTTTRPSNWGKVTVLPEVENVRKEVDKLVQQGIKIIIVLSHAGLEVDRQIAQFGGPIDIIVGGHSHSFLFSGLPVVGPDVPVSDYPTIETQTSGRKVLIVQASAYTKYLGNIRLYFDDDGEIQRFEGAPIFLSNDVPQDPYILQELQPWKKEIDAIQNEVIGTIKQEHDAFCFTRECNMGNLLTDAFAHAFYNNSSEAGTFVIQVPGAIRAGLMPGNVTLADLFTITPYENQLISLELPGHVLRDSLEASVSNSSSLFVLQVSGIKVKYDLKRKPFERIVDLRVLCQKCSVPKYEKVDPSKYYRVVVSDFVANGGDGYKLIPKYSRNHIYGPLDIDALADYVRKFSPIELPRTVGRVQIVQSRSYVIRNK